MFYLHSRLLERASRVSEEYVETVVSPAQLLHVLDRALRVAVGEPGQEHRAEGAGEEEHRGRQVRRIA